MLQAAGRIEQLGTYGAARRLLRPRHEKSQPEIIDRLDVIVEKQQCRKARFPCSFVAELSKIERLGKYLMRKRESSERRR